MKIQSKLRLALCGSVALCAFAIDTLPSATFFENRDVKVMRAQEKAHVKGSFHEHKMNRVMVYLQNGKQRFEYQDSRKPVEFNWKAGQVVFSKPEGMHSPEVTGDQPFNIIEVELKNTGSAKPAASARDALKLDAKHYKLEFENDQVRVLRLKLGAHEATPAIDHAHSTVAICLTDHDAHKAGDATWEAPTTGKMENTGTSPVEMVLVEIKS